MCQNNFKKLKSGESGVIEDLEIRKAKKLDLRKKNLTFIYAFAERMTIYYITGHFKFSARKIHILKFGL